jgi:hypothetical protein
MSGAAEQLAEHEAEASFVSRLTRGADASHFVLAERALNIKQPEHAVAHALLALHELLDARLPR